MNKIKLVKTLKIDINTGFDRTVDKAINAELVNLQLTQKISAEDITLAPMVINGRFVFQTIYYLTENIGDLDD